MKAKRLHVILKLNL